MTILKLYCDGGIIGSRNPGDGVYWSVGKAVGEDERDTEIVVKDATYSYTTNNEAEYLALLAALNYAQTDPAERIMIHSDSQLIVNQFHGRWKCGNERLVPLLRKVRQCALWLQEMGKDIDVFWVKREVNVRRLGH